MRSSGKNPKKLMRGLLDFVIINFFLKTQPMDGYEVISSLRKNSARARQEYAQHYEDITESNLQKTVRWVR